MRTFRICLLTGIMLCAFFFLTTTAFAAEEAQDITAKTTFSGSGFGSFRFLSDGNVDNYQTSNGNAAITLANPNAMAGLYLVFDQPYGEYTITDNTTGESISAGVDGFLHEYIDIFGMFRDKTSSVTLHFNSGAVRLSEISVYSQGTLPKSVQRWQTPLEGCADLVLFSAHGDDEQLYFAGMLPYYAGQMQYGVQLVYMTDHDDEPQRIHEILNALWATGVRAYPVFGDFAAFRVDNLNGTYDRYRNNYNTTQEELLGFVVEQIRRFRPVVAVGHDLQGEYGHGMHQVYADLLTKAVKLTNDANSYPESVEMYGTYEVSKLYLHLYGNNPITMDYDQPLSAFDGMTAFEVSQKLGFPRYKSQQDSTFTQWLCGKNGEITKASQIQTYSPVKFGLYHTTVGPDKQGDDLFENVTTYYQQMLEEEDRLEQERLEQERLEQERLEQEKLEQEQQVIRDFEEAFRKEQTKTKVTVIILVALLVVAIALIVTAPMLIRYLRMKEYYKNSNKTNQS